MLIYTYHAELVYFPGQRAHRRNLGQLMYCVAAVNHPIRGPMAQMTQIYGKGMLSPNVSQLKM